MTLLGRWAGLRGGFRAEVTNRFGTLRTKVRLLGGQTAEMSDNWDVRRLGRQTTGMLDYYEVGLLRGQTTGRLLGLLGDGTTGLFDY